ncbi:hypothetical protein MFIFM68171_04760 [Madurella fahalii]|uniref:Uncharacterized protein n=1 Tax=Madurella fahalii TaxID=1157608 RepID=A0ABQ0GAE2_9PEZI
MKMDPWSFPNVILLDYRGVVISGEWDWEDADHVVRTLIMGLNLYMVCEYRDISMVAHSLCYPKANVQEVESLLVN